ncbi:MAG TPA: hypothetical protein QF650_04645 [Vicinamibacterales bacterium]|nr:hypothetical protein [Vicinamibacterales bacterium]HJO37874.1 hypothetical protein [Vicinamibacterales bacterium]
MAATVHRRRFLLVATLVLLAATRETVLLGLIFSMAWTLETADYP